MSKTKPQVKSSRAFLLALVFVAALLLGGCSPEVERSEFAGPDWSRGIKLGTSHINNRPGVAWDEQTRSALVVWLAQTDGWQMRYARVNDQGQAIAAAALPFAMRLPTRAQLVSDTRGGLHLFWLDSPSGSRPGLYHALISVDGAALSEPQRLSGPDSDVSSYSTARVRAGGLDVFYSDISSGVSLLYHARLAVSGAVLAAPHPLGAEGANPSTSADSEGTVHLTWNQPRSPGGEQILYAPVDPQTQQIGESVVLAAFPMGTGLALYPPEIGLETGRVYVFWALEQRAGGLSPGTAQTHYRTFLTGQPQEVSGGILGLPTPARPDYEPAAGDFNYQALFYLTDPATGAPVQVHASQYTYMHYPLEGQRDEVGLLLVNNMALPRRPEKAQIAFAVLVDGNLKGYEVAARTLSASLRPAAVVDDQGGIHLAWLSLGGFGAYDVYYASTAESVRTALNRITWEDIGASVMGRTWSTASALSFFPLLVIWLFLPFAWLVGFYLFRPDSDLTSATGRVGLIVAIALYLFSKLFMLPAFLWYAPFLDIISPKFELVVLLGVPAVIMGLGLLAMRAYIRRADRKVVMFAFAIFAGIDSVLSLILYMPNAMGG